MRIIIEIQGKGFPTLKKVMSAYVLFVYEELKRNKKHTAKALGVSVRSIRVWAPRMGLKPKYFDEEDLPNVPRQEEPE